MSKQFFRSVAITVLTTLVAATGWADELDTDGSRGVVKKDTFAALEADIALLAQGKGLKKEDVAKTLEFQESFLEYVQNLEARYPDQLSRIWLDPAPGNRAFIQFTEGIPFETPPKNVHLIGHGIISRQEHAYRAELAADAMKAEGYRNFLTFFDARSGKIRIEMAVEEASPEPDHQKVFDLVQDRVWRDQTLSGKALVATPADIDLRVVRKSGPIYTMEFSRGGLWLRDGGVNECTSGWSVSGPNGNGIITAAHCTGLDTIGISNHNLTFRDQERGNGDVEYHTTDGVELAEFWAASNDLRDVKSTKQTIWMLPGNSVCVYGRSSNVRDCTHTIEATGVTATFTDGVTVSKLVRASGDSTIGGDSGGGWSWSTKAWGVHAGSNGVDSYFTPIRRAEIELNVDVLIKP